MPRFSYKCAEHGEFQVSLDKREKEYPCATCGQGCRAIIKVGTTRTVERLDNGLMPKVVERLHNVEEIMEERAQKFSNRGLPDEDSKD